MERIDIASITNWNNAKKVKPVRAKPLVSLLVDKSVTSKFLVDTLEGKEPLGDNVVICIGEFGDIWQQTPKKLLQKYNVTTIDTEGWLFCEPKPDNSVEVVCIERCDHHSDHWYIVGLWGETLDDGTKNVQFGEADDYICRNPQDHSDVWVVRKKIFNNTYVVTE